MCGLTGARCLKGRFRITHEYIDAMRDTMDHRGPDGAGTWVSNDGRVGLGHRRLSIIDLSDSASQPMSSPDGQIQVVFNGEIYNHASLRKELEAQGVTAWKTDHSDTEVIIRAYQTWGIECIHRFIGMFAIAIWDVQTQDLWLIRDRIGIKPLYYSLHHGRLTFASETKALLADPDQPREVNREAMADYLAFICSPGPDTLFKGIKKLAPGCLLRVDGRGNIAERRWYEIWDHVRPDAVAHGEELYEQVHDLLSDAIALRKVGDVPMGVFLSGGVDSSANAVLFSKGLKEPVRTFSIGYDTDHKTYTNELLYARQIAEQVGADHHERLLTEQDLMNFLPKMVHLQDEPIADPVCMPVYYVSKLARENGTTICQVGEGADELFWGYRDWRHWQVAQKLSMAPMSRFGASLIKSGMSVLDLQNHRLFDACSRASQRKPVFWSSAQGPTQKQRDSLLGCELRRELVDRDGWDVIQPLWQRFKDSAWEQSALNWMSFIDLSIRLPELLLMRVDKMSMGASLEARVPFLDHRMVELALAIPEKVKMRHGESKHVLKQSMRRHLPANIIDRPKQGFGVPLDEWLDGRLGKEIDTEMKRFCKETGYFDMDGVRNLMSGQSRVRVWYLYNFALWHRHFIEGVHQDQLIAS